MDLIATHRTAKLSRKEASTDLQETLGDGYMSKDKGTKRDKKVEVHIDKWENKWLDNKQWEIESQRLNNVWNRLLKNYREVERQ